MERVTPFSNGEEFMWWYSRNCDTCKKYENKSTQRSKAVCPYSFDIELCMAGDGKIPLNTAKWIGWNGKELNSHCNVKDIEFKPLTIDREMINQLSLF